MATSASERSEQPTPRRLLDARRKGQIAVSRDLASALSLACALGALVAALPEVRRLLGASVLVAIERAGSADTLDTLSAWSAIEGAIRILLTISLPVGIAALSGGVLGTLLQTQCLVSGSSLVPKPERFNPVAGLKRLVAARTVVEFAKTWTRVAAIGLAAVIVVAADGLAALVSSSWTRPGDAMQVAARLSTVAAITVATLSVLIGGVDVLIQRWLHARELRMTKDEVRRDHREEEGDPHVKQARKRIHRELALTTMLRATRTASFVAVNPTHLSVAIAYDEEHDGAPRLVAKGAGAIAMQIRREAERVGVRVVRNKPLARALFALPVDVEIPEELYVAVAETLAFVAELSPDRNPER